MQSLAVPDRHVLVVDGGAVIPIVESEWRPSPNNGFYAIRTWTHPVHGTVEQHVDGFWIELADGPHKCRIVPEGHVALTQKEVGVPTQRERDLEARVAVLEVENFNLKHPVGTLVRYWRGVREGRPSGEGPTIHAADLLGGHTPVVWIAGCSGCIALSHVEAIG